MVITGAPNLSNEAKARREVRTVSEGESSVWRMRIERAGAIGGRTERWSCRERGVHVSLQVWSSLITQH